ncbi:MAG: SCO2322 family protein, partial [Candidatus Nanopelagicales bacterium]
MKRAGLLRWALATSVAGLVVASGAPAQATAYRYWSYWLGSDGAWTYANAGPAFRIPTDGTVEGWRFSVDGGGGGLPPRTSADFDTVCAGTPVQEGLKRVAVIVDPGSVEDAPPGQSPPGAWALCVSAVDKATGYD